MTLFDLALQNKKLVYIDDVHDSSYTLSEIANISFADTEKKLFFAYLDNTVASISIFWSLMKSKHCIALLSPHITNHFKNELEEMYHPTYIFDTTRNSINGYNLICKDKTNYFNITNTNNYSINQNIKVLISTSGTTGSPKFVKLSEDNLILNALAITQYLPIQDSDVTPLNLPIFYSYGLSVLTSNSIKGGKIICSNDDLLKKTFWENFIKYGYTSFAGVPFVYEMLDRIGFTKKTYPSLKYFTQAGGKLQDHLVKKYGEYALQNNKLFFVMYGQTEATARMSYLPPSLTLKKIGSIGKPIPNGEFILDNETGELCYKGLNVFGGYVENISDLEWFTQETILRTGDIAKVDEDGFYYITGRLKRFSKLYGNRINLDEVENIVAKQLFIDIKCIGVNDSQLIIFCATPEVDLKSVIQFISTELKLHISVIKSFFVEQFPLTNNGKINYIELTKTYAAK